VKSHRYCAYDSKHDGIVNAAFGQSESILAAMLAKHPSEVGIGRLDEHDIGQRRRH
jgi:hypothetical protein